MSTSARGTPAFLDPGTIAACRGDPGLKQAIQGDQKVSLLIPDFQFLLFTSVSCDRTTQSPCTEWPLPLTGHVHASLGSTQITRGSSSSQPHHGHITFQRFSGCGASSGEPQLKQRQKIAPPAGRPPAKPDPVQEPPKETPSEKCSLQSVAMQPTPRVTTVTVRRSCAALPARKGGSSHCHGCGYTEMPRVTVHSAANWSHKHKLHKPVQDPSVGPSLLKE